MSVSIDLKSFLFCSQLPTQIKNYIKNNYLQEKIENVIQCDNRSPSLHYTANKERNFPCFSFPDFLTTQTRNGKTKTCSIKKHHTWFNDMSIGENDPATLVYDEARGIAGTSRLSVKCSASRGTKHNHRRDNLVERLPPIVGGGDVFSEWWIDFQAEVVLEG